jgi:hypothetical protein
MATDPLQTATAAAPATAQATAAATPGATTTPIAGPTATAAATSTADATAAPADIEEFIEELGAAIAGGRGRFMLQNLHPAVIERYGEQACQNYTAVSSIPGLQLDYINSEGPEPWDWVLDDVTTNIPDAWTVTVRWRQPPDTDEARDVHIAPAEAAWRWFTDCGEPL